MNNLLIKIYKDVVECHSPICQQYGEVFDKRDSSSLPRGFFTEASGSVQLLVVGKNPGHMLKSEAILYSPYQ